MDADTLGGTVIDRGEDGYCAFGNRECGGGIGSPHLVRLIGSDR
jgi:hypothetical protein